MKQTVDRLLERVGVLKHPCDLDLLLFFSRHPRTLISGEGLAVLVGYDVAEVAKSIDVLIGGGFLQRSQNRTRSARMYVLTTNGPAGGWLPALLRLASTHEGRTAVIRVLKARLADAPPDTGPEQTSDAIRQRKVRYA